MNTKESKSKTKNKKDDKKQGSSNKKGSSKKKEENEKGRVEQMPIKNRPKKKTSKKKEKKEAKEKSTKKKEKKSKKKEAKDEPTQKKEKQKEAKKQEPKIPEEWKEPKKEGEEKRERKSLIETLRRSISLRGPPKEEEEISPMNLVVTLNPLKHRDIIEYIEENISSGGRAEWVRDSIRLKMRVEEGVYGLNASEKSQKETQEMMQSVFGQFAEVMTQVMTDLKNQGGMRGGRPSSSVRQSRPRSTRDRRPTGGPPKLKKVEGKGTSEDLKPERPALDDAIGSIVVVE